MNLETIRDWQFNKMAMTSSILESIVYLSDADTLVTNRDVNNGWTATETMGHLRDFETVFIQRAELTINEDNPILPFPDPDELAAQRNYNNIGWNKLYDEWLAERHKLLMFFKAREEADWERIAQHPTRGPFTLHDQLFLTTIHDSIHIEQIMRILR